MGTRCREGYQSQSQKQPLHWARHSPSLQSIVLTLCARGACFICIWLWQYENYFHVCFFFSFSYCISSNAEWMFSNGKVYLRVAMQLLIWRTLQESASKRVSEIEWEAVQSAVVSSTFCFICAILALPPIEMRSNRIRIRRFRVVHRADGDGGAAADATSLYCPPAESSEMATDRRKVLAPSLTHSHPLTISWVEHQQQSRSPLQALGSTLTGWHSPIGSKALSALSVCHFALKIIGCLQTPKQIATAGYIW